MDSKNVKTSNEKVEVTVVHEKSVYQSFVEFSKMTSRLKESSVGKTGKEDFLNTFPFGLRLAKFERILFLLRF
jgi:hypothetical protein